MIFSMLYDAVSLNIFIQVIGFAAVALSFAVFQVNHRATMLKLMLCAGLLYTAHFYLLGAATGAALNLVGAARNYAFAKASTHGRTKLLPGIFIVLFMLATLLSWQGLISLLPLGGVIIGTIAFWQTNTRHIRRTAILIPPLWFTYNLISGSYPGMLVELVMLGSNLIGMYRFDFKPTLLGAAAKKQKQTLIKP